MANGWFVFALVGCIVVASGFVLAVALMRAAWAHREREALTSTDLRALEESAVLLIEQIKSEADAAVTEIDKRRKALSKLIKEADTKLQALTEAQSFRVSDAECPDKSEADVTDVVRILDLAESGLEVADISKATGIDCAEVNLVLNLHKSLAA